ncbi:MAG: hypothetical protein LBQ30_05505 [Treponema sp.]|nr:hypothetical protein [Treponema sp.]
MELITVTAKRSLPTIFRKPNGAAFITTPFVIVAGSNEITSAISLAPVILLATSEN